MLNFFYRALNNKKGFTLIEVLVVVAIIGILIALAAPRVIRRIDDAREASDRATAKVLNDAIITIELDFTVNPDKYPDGWVTGDITWGELKVYLEDESVVTFTGADTDTIGVDLEAGTGITLAGRSRNFRLEAVGPGGTIDTADGLDDDDNPITITTTNDTEVYKFYLVSPAEGETNNP